MSEHEVKPVAVLVGPPGAGKSTVGRRLARALGVEFVDTDALIAERAGMDCGDVFAKLGEPAFRELESECVAAALRTPGVVSLGGGAVVTERNRTLLHDVDVIWLDVSAAAGIERTATGNRPVLAADDPLIRYQALLDERRPLYKDVAGFRAKTDHRSPQQVVAEILSYLESEDD